jgi:transcription antitermination protein NusB
MDKVKQKPQSKARELAIQFLYRCEIEEIIRFEEAKFNEFLSEHDLELESENALKSYCKGILSDLQTLDGHISKLSKSWQISRLPMLDRAILRLGVYELLESKTPYKVILNETIELAKRYGTQKSPGFVNGLLDAAAKSIRGDKS